MPNAQPASQVNNPTINNPAVSPTASFVLPRGDGFGSPTDPFLFDLGQTAFPEASMTTIVTGSPASITLQLQGSVDGTNWTTLATSTSTTGDTQIQSAQALPVSFEFTTLRVLCSALSGGTNPKVAVTLMAFQDKQNLPLHNSVASGGGAVGTAQLVSTGNITAGTAQPGVTSGNGVPIDFGSAKRSITFQITATGTVTAGAVTMQVSLDGTTWSTPPIGSFTNESAATAANPYVLVSNTTGLFALSNVNARYARAAITTTVTGGATCTALISAS